MNTKTRILIVEDEGLIATELKQMLTTSGYEITAVVASGEQALRSAAADPPELVLMDIKLSGALDGIATAAQIRTRQNIPIIYLTGHADDALFDRAKATTPFGYLLKPFQTRDLLVAIEIARYKHKIDLDLQETNRQLEQEVLKHTLAEETLKRQQTDLQRLSAQLINAQEAERRRISRELHDELGQALTAMSLNLRMIAKDLPAESIAPLRERLQETIALVDWTLEQIRELSHTLWLSILDDLGLAPALRWYVNKYSQRLALEVRFEALHLEQRLPAEIETALYRVTQEALTNIAKHAKATRVALLLERTASSVNLVIEDNGQGFEFQAITAHKTFEHGLGLLGMRERVAFLKGHFQIQSAPGQGTRLSIEIPLS